MTTDRLVVLAFSDVFIRYGELQRFACPIEPCEPVFRHGRLVPVDIGDAAVAFSVNVSDQGLQSPHIVGEDRRPVVEGVIQADDGDIGKDQLLDHRIQKVRADDGHTVQTSGPRMLQIAGVHGAHVVADERDIVSAALRLHPKVVEHGSEVFMHEPAVRQICENDADAVGPIGLQSAGGGVRREAQLLGRVKDLLLRGLAHVPSPVEGFADRTHGDAAVKRDILHGDHGNTSLRLENVFVIQ